MKFERLGNICSVRNGYAFKSANFSNSGVPIIRISDINDNLVSVENAVKTEYEPNFENFKIEKGDILIAMSGATTGKYGQYNEDETAYQNQRVGCFKILDTSILNQNYLFQSIKLLKPVIEKKAYGGGQPNISAKAIEDLIIPLPSLETQLHIADILSKAESLIAQRKESIRLLDEYLKSVFLEMFGDPVRNEKVWEISLLGDICGVGSSKRVFVEELVESGIPFYRGTEIGQMAEGIEILPSLFVTEDHYKQLKAHTDIPKIGDLLMPSICPDGRIYRVINDRPFYFKDGRVLWVKVDKSPIDSIYLQAVLKVIFRTNYNNIASGTTFVELKIVALKQINVPVAPIELQTQFAQIVEKTEALKAQYQQSLQELENLYGSLSQKAFKGELSIKDESLLMAAEPETKYGEK